MTKLTCKSCGGKLEITDDIETCACGYCGSEWHVEHSGGVVSLKAIEERLNGIEKNTSESLRSNKQIEKHSRQTSESSSLVANEAKLRIIKEKMAACEEEKKQIVNQMNAAIGQWDRPMGCIGLVMAFAISYGISSLFHLGSCLSNVSSCLYALVANSLLWLASYAALMFFIRSFFRKEELEILRLDTNIKDLSQKHDTINREIEKSYNTI